MAGLVPLGRVPPMARASRPANQAMGPLAIRATLGVLRAVLQVALPAVLLVALLVVHLVVLLVVLLAARQVGRVHCRRLWGR